MDIIHQRTIRQEYNNELAFNTITTNLNNPNKKHINEKALIRLLNHLNYDNLDDIFKDKKEYKKNMIKIISLYISKNASRQGIIDENAQLQKINILQEYNIKIQKDGKRQPIKKGGMEISIKNQVEKLKSIDFVIKYKTKEIGYITAKVTIGQGGHQDNVLHEMIQFCEWSLLEIKKNNKKVYIILYDSINISILYDDICKKYTNKNLIFTTTIDFKNKFLNWFNK